MADSEDFRNGLAERIARFDREAARANAARAEEERQRVLHEFPLDSWPKLELKRYALGPSSIAYPGYSFCRLMEYGTNSFGSIRGGSAAKHIIFQHRSGEWRVIPAFLRRLGTDEAWGRVRSDFERAFTAAEARQYDVIDELETLSYGQALTTKALAVYFPDAFLPIFSASHVRSFTELLGGKPHQNSSGIRTWRANRELLSLVRRTPEFDGWQSHEVMEFLYWFHDPRPRNRVVWKIAPGQRGHLWDECREQHNIRIAWDEVGSLDQYESDQELKQALDQEWPATTGGHLRLARQLLAYRDLEPGDLIVANRGKSEVLALGTVAEGYTYEPGLPEYRHQVGVDWDTSYAQTFDTPHHAWQPALAKVPESLLRRIRQGRGTSAAAVAPPVAGIGTPGHVQQAPDLLSHKEQPVVPGTVQQVLDLLDRKGQVILQGPPGTGKTRLALSVALALAGRHDLIEDATPEERAEALAALFSVPDSPKTETAPKADAPGTDTTAAVGRLTMVTFHPSYGYEDFVEGFKPNPAADGAGLNLQRKDGLFLRVCAAAEKAPDDIFLIIIDEINRGDLPRILGELITVLELDKRGSVHVTLPTSGGRRSVPSNVRIIGTMNTADRSVGHIDAAIRRRFAFIDVPTDLDALDGEIEGLGLAAFLEGLNTRLDRSFGPDQLLGQAYLLEADRPLATVEQLYDAFHHDVVPLVSDYCLGQPELLKEVLGQLVDQRTGRIVQTSPQDLPGMLAAEFVDAQDDK
ncbi:AAA family ATPase [Streptomyces sp. NPDC059802]|uniref:AAA family ATPase n=1 Tax=Streptomyces sp. NPDC059802 TaxID=3346952 RepID=UPI00364DEAB0